MNILKISMGKVAVGLVLVSLTSVGYSATCDKSVCIVKSGDTLEAIGKQVKVSWETLVKINNIKDVKRIMPGDKIKYK